MCDMPFILPFFLDYDDHIILKMFLISDIVCVNKIRTQLVFFYIMALMD